MAWKKASERKSLESSSGLDEPAKNSSVTLRYEPVRLARSPFGGSLVIFTDCCSTGTGKSRDGSDVSHSRKLNAQALLAVMRSQMSSSLRIHDGAR